MLNLLTCPRGHFWESPDPSVACPECGAPADSLPLLDLAPSEITAELPPPVVPLDVPLIDADGRPVVAGFEIREDLGRSHAGVRRYRARQLGINRDVLLEVVVAKEDAGQHAWGSLRGESSALGKLSHPNIVSIFDTGERDRQLFYSAVEFIDGPTLAQIVEKKPLPFDQVMRLVELLARAVDHAHDRGLLHRNLRPSCVLLQPVRLPKDAEGPAGAVCRLHDGYFIPKLTGFGVVRKAIEGEAIDSEVYGDQAGYLSPEQAWGRARDLGPNTDVYGLGGLLYFLLSGRPPFRGPSLTDVLDAIQTAELVPPSSMRSVPADLEAICKHCLIRSPRRRYATADEVADELARARRGESITAKPPTGSRKIGRWIARHPGVFVMTLLLLATLIGTAVLYFDAADEVALAKAREKSASDRLNQLQHEATRLRAQADRSRQVQEFLTYKQKLDRAQRELARDEKLNASNTLEGVPDAQRGFEWHYLMARVQGGGSYALSGFKEDLTAFALGPRGKTVATALPGKANFFNQRKGHVQIWDVVARAETRSWVETPGPVHALAFSPDGSRLAAGGGNISDSDGVLSLFNVEDRSVTLAPSLGSRVTALAYADGGQRIAVGRGNGTLALLSASDGQAVVPHVGVAGFGEAQAVRLGAMPASAVSVAAFVAGASEVKAYSTANGGVLRTFPGDAEVQAVALGETSDGRTRESWIAIARADASVTIYDLMRYGDEVRLSDLGRSATRLAFSPDGNRLAAAFPDGSVRVWAQAGGAWLEMLTLSGKGEAGLAFSPSGKALAAGGGREVRVWGVLDD